MAKTTDYHNTFISVAPDCPRESAEVPPERKNKTIARQQYEMLADDPYVDTSDDVVFSVYADRNDVPADERAEERETFFYRGRACLRSSPLAKRYGWGFHFDEDGKVALYAVESDEYEKYANDEDVTQLKAMRSSR